MTDVNLEFKRQSIHILLGLFFIFLVSFFPLGDVLILTFLLLILGFVLSSAQAHGSAPDEIEKILAHVERTNEDFPGEGALFFVIGVFLVLLFFQNQLVVIGALIAHTFYDSFSVLIGKRFGKIKLIQNYTLEGCAGGILAAFIPLFFVFDAVTAIIVSFTAAIAELLPINDSLSIPLLTALVLSFLI